MGSAAEVECLLRMARDLEYLPENKAIELEALVGGTMRVMMGLLRAAVRTAT